MSNDEQTIVRFRLPKPGEVIKTAARSIRKCLLRRHLWHPISTAPAGVWINADLGTSLQIEPIAWRLWQKAGSLEPYTPASSWKRPRPLLQRAYVIRAIGAIFVVLGAAAWGGVAQSQVSAMNLRSEGGVAFRQVAPDLASDGTTTIPARLHRQVVAYRSAPRDCHNRYAKYVSVFHPERRTGDPLWRRHRARRVHVVRH
jgi:hypothetical protein